MKLIYSTLITLIVNTISITITIIISIITSIITIIIVHPWYRATLAAKKIAEFVKACGNGLKWANIFYQMLKRNGGGAQ